jgi:putative ABC transport system permease protein
MLANYLKIAWRNLLRNKIYSLVNITGLAMGLAACLAIGLHVQDEYSYDRFHRKAADIYRLTEIQQQADGTHPVAVTPGPLAPSLAADYPEIVHSVRVGQWGYLLQAGRTGIEPEKMLIVDNDFFKMFDFKLMMGNPAKALTGPDEIVISEKLAAQFFGSDWRKKSVLGKVLTLNAEQPLTVVGVVFDPPTNSHLQFDALLPFKYVEKYDEWGNKWNSNSYHTYLELQPGTDAMAFEQKITNYFASHDVENKASLHLQPLKDIYLYSKFDFGTDWGKRSDIFYVRIFLAVGFIVLLIAIINFINLATARASQRAREVGVRKSVGALRGSLVWQFLSESFLLTTLALVLALVIFQAALPLFNVLVDKQLSLPTDQPAFWGYFAGFAVVVSLLAGTYPAFFLSAFRPAKVLKGIVDVKSGVGFRQTLVVGQFVLSIALCIGTIVIYRQLDLMQNKKLGFDKSQLLYVKLKGDSRGKALLFKEEVAKLAGVAAVSTTTSTLVDVGNESYVEWEGQEPNDKFLITQMNVDADFLKTAGLSLATGRNFSTTIPADTSDTFGKYLINESAAQRMGWTDETALGKRVKFWGFEGEVIGVVKDFHFRPLRSAISPIIFRFRPKEFYFNLLVKTSGVNLPQILTEIGKIHKAKNPNYPLSYGFVDQDLAAQYRSEQKTSQIVLYFSVLAILISCLGLFGLTTFTAETRTKEIGIRKVLGASVASIVALLSKDFIKLVLMAIVIASPIAWYAMHEWLADFAYKIDIAWWIFALAGGLAVAIALLTVSLQSVKAALMNPVKSLRSE